MKTKLSLVLFLFSLSFFSHHTNANLLKSRILSPEAKPPTIHVPKTSDRHTSFQDWCHKIPPYEKLCSNIIQADPRSHLKSDPKGLVTILVDAAKANSNSTKLLLKNLLIKNKKEGGNKTTEALINHCLKAYDYVQHDLKVNMTQLSSREGRKQVMEALTDADYELSYDCEFARQPFMFPLVDPMFIAVDAFTAIMRAACAILNMI